MTSSLRPRIPPAGWGDDTLSAFFDDAQRNCHATFVNKSLEYRRLARIDDCFMRLAYNWLDPDHLLTPMLMLRAHSAFRAMCANAMAGQSAESFTQARSCLEYAGYAIHMKHQPGVDELWLRRHEDENSLHAVRSAFVQAKIRASIVTASPRTAEIFNSLYQRAIDFGAHPNERSVTGNTVLSEKDGRKTYLQIYLHGEGLALDHALRNAAQVGCCALDITAVVFPERFGALRIGDDLASIKVGL